MLVEENFLFFLTTWFFGELLKSYDLWFVIIKLWALYSLRPLLIAACLLLICFKEYMSFHSLYSCSFFNKSGFDQSFRRLWSSAGFKTMSKCWVLLLKQLCVFVFTLSGVKWLLRSVYSVKSKRFYDFFCGLWLADFKSYNWLVLTLAFRLIRRGLLFRKFILFW